ncbi:MAG: serine O-acetyltransferase [Myxococcota bacterium]
MPEKIPGIADHLRALREADDPLSAARNEVVPDRGQVLEVLELLRAVLLDGTPARDLDSDLEICHAHLTRLVGRGSASRVLARTPEIRSCLALDVQAAFDGDPAATSYAEIVACYPSLFAVSTFRIAHALYQMGEPVIARIMAEHAHSRTGIDIHPGAFIGCHFFIDHGTGVVVGETTIIGNRAKLYHGVTLGAFSNREGRLDAGKKRHPTIEDDVTIYPNATVLGGDTVVGHGSVIGGNVWLTHSLPPRSTVTIEDPALRIRQASERRGEGDYDI